MSKEPVRVAVTVSGNTVSPLFETARQLLVADLDTQGQVIDSRRVSIEDLELGQRVAHLADLGVQMLLCGGITGFIQHALVERGVRVYSWVSGEVDVLLQQTIWRLKRGKVQRDTIAVAADGANLATAQVVGFGRCSHYIICAGNSQPRVLRTPDCGSGGWLGRTSLLHRNDVTVLVACSCGPNAMGTLSAAGIEVVTDVEGTVEEAIATLTGAGGG